MAKAVIFDYGVGNLLSLKTALEKAGLSVTIGTTHADLADADAIALPGVGSFTAALEQTRHSKRHLAEQKVSEGTPILGICLGMQLFFESSEEGPGEGLAFFKGNVVNTTQNRQSSPYGMEHTKHRQTKRALRRHTRGHIRLLRTLTLPSTQRPKHRHNQNRVRHNLHLRSRKRQHLRHTVPPRKIRRCRTQNPKELRQDSC